MLNVTVTHPQPIDREIELLLSDTLSAKARSAKIADVAKDEIEKAKAIDQGILGRLPRYTITVDGREGASLESVRPDGEIVVTFQLLDDVLQWIAQQLVTHSPRRSGRYAESHTLFADGQLTDVGEVIPTANEYVFTTLLPYARKIERGASVQAPDGVYQAVALLAQRRFGNQASITFAYRTVSNRAFVGGRVGDRSERRNPAIVVTLR